MVFHGIGPTLSLALYTYSYALLLSFPRPPRLKKLDSQENQFAAPVAREVFYEFIKSPAPMLRKGRRGPKVGHLRDACGKINQQNLLQREADGDP